jgi:16S rRNA processing protein RimM
MRGNKEYLEAGKIVAVHGVKGEVRVQAWCDTPNFLCGFKTLYTDGGSGSLKTTAARAHKNMAIIKFDGVDAVEQAESLRGKVLYIDRDDAELPNGSYFVQDLLGLSVLDFDGGGEIGVIFDISATGANDVYHVRTNDGKTLLLPAIADVIKAVDLSGGSMTVHLLDGLSDI